MDTEEGNGVILFEDQLNLEHLKQLMSEFAVHQPTDEMPDDGTYSPGRIIRREAGNVTLGEFKNMVRSLLKSSDWDAHLEALFAKVDTSADGMVDWNEFVTYMLLHYRENDNMKLRKNVVFNKEPKIRHIAQNKQDIVWCNIVLENPCRYITLSKEGTLCLFDENLRLETCLEIKDGTEDPRNGSKRRFKTWYSDIVFMANVNMIAIGSNSRTIRFWDIVNTKTCIEQFNLYALSDIPSCMDYWYDKKNPSGESILVMGSDKGSINLFYFLKPQEKIFETPFKPEDTVQKIWMHNICQHQKYVRHVVIPYVHTEYIRKVRYLPDKDFILSSSGCRKTPLIMMDIQGKRKSYTYKLSKGVECFDYNRSMNVIATGGIDHVVRLWNPYVQDKPIAFLRGHTMAVVGVVINDRFKHVYSFAKDGVVKVWDLYEYTCLQTISVRFPCLQNARNPEFGMVNMVLYQGRELMTACADYIALLSLGRNNALERRIPVTHETQLCCTVYNSFFKMVATAADDSSISIWNVETGAKSFTIPEAHGNEEITCLTISTTGRKLYSGARNGTIKVWSFQNGHSIHECESVGDDEITGLISVGKKKGFLSVGWSRKIVQYQDGDCDTSFLKANTNWKGGQVHKDDILAFDYSPPSLLATASFDGEILIWSLETQKISVRLRRGQPTIISQRLKAVLSLLGVNVLAMKKKVLDMDLTPEERSKVRSRPNSRHRRNHKQPEGFSQPPVEKLLFLSSRLSGGMSDSAVLVSSEAGHLHFWAIYGQKRHHRGSFYSSDSAEEDESVLALSTNADNSLLISGDTMGHVYIWGISNHCIYPTNIEDNSRPPLIKSWKAHDSTVVSVEYIDHHCGQFLLTASTDFTARLWTLEGHFVGTFGQSMNWDLMNPNTYQHPKDPWTEDKPPPKKKDSIFERVVSEGEEEDDVFDDGDVKVEDITLPPEDNTGNTELTKENLAMLPGSKPIQSRRSRGSSAGKSSSSENSRKSGELSLLDVNLNTSLVGNANVSGHSSSPVQIPVIKQHTNSKPGSGENRGTSKTEIGSMPAIAKLLVSASAPEAKSGFFATQRDQSALSSISRVARTSESSSGSTVTQTAHPLPPISKSLDALPEETDTGSEQIKNKDGARKKSNVDGTVRSCSQSDQSEGSKGNNGPIKQRKGTVTQPDDDRVRRTGSQGSRSVSSSGSSNTGNLEDIRLGSRSNTSLLGRHVDEGLARITNSRSERRQRFGDIDVTRVSRFGKICAPFQALATQSTKAVEFPSTLPMTQRMKQRGVSCTNETDLEKLTLTPLQLEFKSDRSTYGGENGGAMEGAIAAVRRATQLEPLPNALTGSQGKK
ncbi:WD repeat-containing protein on Y chromosome-like [Lytechinus variegatus]|uniref:WD repeat-containing protein on Y chromosome-like n=1 Tax=Lytechinus variegatus TaxID=7654 RepID=UPI001BB17D97|nr:WD repeat-containing protein on Y chromosome-like [Lytechinus variegatus]